MRSSFRKGLSVEVKLEEATILHISEGGYKLCRLLCGQNIVRRSYYCIFRNGAKTLCHNEWAPGGWEIPLSGNPLLKRGGPRFKGQNECVCSGLCSTLVQNENPYN